MRAAARKKKEKQRSLEPREPRSISSASKSHKNMRRQMPTLADVRGSGALLLQHMTPTNADIGQFEYIVGNTTSRKKNKHQRRKRKPSPPPPSRPNPCARVFFLLSSSLAADITRAPQLVHGGLPASQALQGARGLLEKGGQDLPFRATGSVRAVRRRRGLAPAWTLLRPAGLGGWAGARFLLFFFLLGAAAARARARAAPLSLLPPPALLRGRGGSGLRLDACQQIHLAARLPRELRVLGLVRAICGLPRPVALFLRRGQRVCPRAVAPRPPHPMSDAVLASLMLLSGRCIVRHLPPAVRARAPARRAGPLAVRLRRGAAAWPVASASWAGTSAQAAAPSRTAASASGLAARPPSRRRPALSGLAARLLPGS